MQNKLRKGYDSESWSLISTIIPSSVGCKLCPGSDDRVEETFRIENGKGAWTCKSIVDPYPLTHPSIFKFEGNGELFQSFNAHGWSEVVVETKDHVKELHELTAEEIKNILLVYINRINELKKRENVEQICIFKDNLRLEFEHSYSKIVTLPIITKKIKEKLDKFNDFRFKHEECLYCNLIKSKGLGSRTILENDHFVCLVPYIYKVAVELSALYCKFNKSAPSVTLIPAGIKMLSESISLSGSK